MPRILTRVGLAAVAAVLACATVLVSPTPAWACSCRPTTTQQSLENADAAFQGLVTTRDRAGHGQDARTEFRFDVARVFKGRVFSDQVVLSPQSSAACGIDAEVGSTWIIFATSSIEGTGDRAVTRLTTTLCSGNLPGATVPAQLGRGQFPLPGASDSEEKSARADARVDRALKIAGFAALGLIVLGAVAIAVLWRPGRTPA